MKQSSAKPINKVVAGGTAGTIAALLVYLAARVWHIDIPYDIALLAAGLLVAAIGAAAAYLTPPSDKDAPVPAARSRRDPIGHEERG
jgi:hypothetical protein